MGRDLAVNGNFSFRLSGKKHAAFQRMDLPTLFVFSPWLLCFKKVKGSVCVGGAWGGAVCLEGSKQKGKRVGNDCYQPKVLLWLAAALFMIIKILDNLVISVTVFLSNYNIKRKGVRFFK